MGLQKHPQIQEKDSKLKIKLYSQLRFITEKNHTKQNQQREEMHGVKSEEAKHKPPRVSPCGVTQDVLDSPSTEFSQHGVSPLEAH